jgi:tetratricopeptide (TPR) repeat protein
VGDCSLKSLEAHAVGHVRVGDIDGWMIPDTYFRYLRSGERALLDPILEHNKLDLLSLACLTRLVLAAIENPHAAPLIHGPEWFGLGTLFEQHRRMHDAAACFERAIAAGLPDELKRRCARSLSLVHKRAGSWDHAVEIWEQTSKKSGAGALFELEELAKFYEHRERDLHSAREVCRRAISMLEIRAEISGTDSAGYLERFEHRLRRIERKIKHSL